MESMNRNSQIYFLTINSNIFFSQSKINNNLMNKNFKIIQNKKYKQIVYLKKIFFSHNLI
jgi:hypothetical protein